MSMESAAQFLGMPAKKARRGRGKGKSKGSSASHLANLQAAHASGDHAATRSHAFKLIRSLPAAVDPDMDAAQDSAPSTGGATPPMPMSAASLPSGSSPAKAAPSGLSKLAGFLTSRKTR